MGPTCRGYPLPPTTQPPWPVIATHVPPNPAPSRSRPQAQTEWNQFPSISPTLPHFPPQKSSTVVASILPCPAMFSTSELIKMHPGLPSSVSPNSPPFPGLLLPQVAQLALLASCIKPYRQRSASTKLPPKRFLPRAPEPPPTYTLHHHRRLVLSGQAIASTSLAKLHPAALPPTTTKTQPRRKTHAASPLRPPAIIAALARVRRHHLHRLREYRPRHLSPRIHTSPLLPVEVSFFPVAGLRPLFPAALCLPSRLTLLLLLTRSSVRSSSASVVLWRGLPPLSLRVLPSAHAIAAGERHRCRRWAV